MRLPCRIDLRLTDSPCELCTVTDASRAGGGSMVKPSTDGGYRARLGGAERDATGAGPEHVGNPARKFEFGRVKLVLYCTVTALCT